MAPLWAGLIARLAQATGKKFGLLQPLIYGGVTAGAAAQGFNDITQGNNGAYSAGPGWDATTGLGSPNGQALLTHLSDPPPRPRPSTTEKPQATTGGSDQPNRGANVVDGPSSTKECRRWPIDRLRGATSRA